MRQGFMMRRLFRCCVLVIWLIMSSLGLTLYWIRDTSAWAPIPQWVWKQVNQRVEVRCCEHAADVEYLVVFTAAALTMVVATALVWILMRWLRGRKRLVR
ncbi:hypothetical protein [Achromobacter arsenitoxydans]|uniref:Uncharacterized protein n=1 Tax=Achromobacter arsenitoxydans SY8 TaxID=477184 RepID=H0F5A7_9BURK|nr:hypothetical protein [Achromobacter arsenitoxydans]EHK66421.1 hypothetical protein KYC_09751 [Achromobacter arsenitoxydans SY8]